MQGGVVLITETTFDGNRSDGAGAILVDSQNATLIVNDSAFVENISFGTGSALQFRIAVVSTGAAQYK